MRTLLAHEDLQVSDEWRDRIVDELRTYDVLVALLSESFEASRWATQEVGFMGIERPDVVIAPISIDGTRSFGFFGHMGRSGVLPIAGLITFLGCSRCGDKTCRQGRGQHLDNRSRSKSGMGANPKRRVRERLELSPSSSKYWTASTREDGESRAIDVDDFRKVSLLSSDAAGG